MNTLAIIPARMGSQRLPDKNIKSFIKHNGRSLTLVDAAIEFAMRHVPCGKVLLTTDYMLREFGSVWDMAYEESIEKFMYHPRRPELCTPETTMAEVVTDALDRYERELKSLPDAFILLQPTSPIRDHRDILQALELYMVHGAKAVCSVNPAFKPNGNFYLMDTALFRETKTFFPEGLYPLEQDWKHSIDIDTEQDFRMAQHLMGWHEQSSKVALH